MGLLSQIVNNVWLRPEGINSSARKKEVSVQMEGREELSVSDRLSR